MLSKSGGYDQTIPCIFTMNKRSSVSHWSHSKQVYHQGSKNNTLKNSFSHRVQNLWNYLPEEVVSAKNAEGKETLFAFENALDRHWHDQKLMYDFEAKIVKKKFDKKGSGM